MNPTTVYLRTLIAVLAGRLAAAHHRAAADPDTDTDTDTGSVTLEQVVIASVLFIAAVGLVAVIVNAIKSREASIK